MSISNDKLVGLVASDRPADVRAAGLIACAELGVKDAALAKRVVELLTDPSSTVRIQAIRAAGRLKVEKALPILLDKIAHGGDEGDLAAKACANLGAAGLKSLHELITKVVPGVRKYIAVALAEAGVNDGEGSGVKVFMETDPGVAEAAANTLVNKASSLPPAKKESFAKELVKLATTKKPALPGTSEGPIVRVVAALGGPTSEAFLWTRVGPNFVPVVRALALQALSNVITKATKDEWAKLFAAAGETDFQVVAPALMCLEKLPYSTKQISDWVKLLHAPDLAARRLAVQKAGTTDTAEVAEGLIEQLRHSDRNVREAAKSALVKLEHGRAALLQELYACASPEASRNFAQAIAPSAGAFSAKARSEVFARVSKYLDNHDPRADSLLNLLREMDANELREKLYDRGVELRKKKKYEEAVSTLKLLGRDPAVGGPIRFELACVGLKVSGKELEREFRHADPCLQQFGHLAGHGQDELLTMLEKAKWLDPEDLFYVGFHFAEDIGPMKKLGAEILKLVITRSPKGKIAASAKGKLKTIAL